MPEPLRPTPQFADSAAPVSPESGGTTTPAHPGGEELTAQLGRLVESARDYAAAYPEAAAVGGWWNARPVTEPPSSPVMRVGEGREAAVLMLFCAGIGDLADSGLGAPARFASDAGPDGPEVLLTERSAGLKKHPGQISFPGGAREESDLDAAAVALRESQEEVGLDVDRLTVLGALPPAPVPVSGFMVSPVLAAMQDPGVLTPQTGEVDRVLRVPVHELVSPRNRCSSALRRRGVTLKTPAFLLGDTLVWGFTGILLDRVLNRLGWAQPWDVSREVDPRDYQAFG